MDRSTRADHRRRSLPNQRRREPVLALESLEHRLALCVDHIVSGFIDPATGGTAVGQQTGFADAFAVSLAAASSTLPSLDGQIQAAATAANGLPELNSLPGAPAALYLDFDGEGSNAAYDVDGNPATFNATEAATITEAWRQISVYFSMFDLNVTTVKPTVPFAWHVSSPSITGGYSYVGVFPNSSPQSFNNDGDARSRVSGIAHELGHNLGLNHQSEYDLLGNKTKEYSSGYDALHGPIMGVDYAQSVHKWFIGHPSNSASALQDDVAVIAAVVKRYQKAGGDGFRADDFGGTLATATPLAGVEGMRTTDGIIERMSDVDMFSFTTDGGTTFVSAIPTKPSGADIKVEIFDASGVLVAASDGGTNNQELTVPLGSGTWYVSVSSHGDYGDLGMYELAVNDLPTGWGTADIGSVGNPGMAGYDPTTGTFVVAGSGADIWGTADGARFAYQSLTGNGSIIARVVQNQATHAWAKVGVEMRESLAAGSKHVAMVTSASNGPQLVSRTSTGGSSTSVNSTASAFAPMWVRLVRAGTSITASRSTDGSSWTTVGSVTVSMASTIYVGLITTSHDNAKINEGRFTDVSFTGAINQPASENALPAPAGVTLARGTAAAVTVSWQAVAGATGYAVERSANGVDFSSIATPASSATSYTDASLAISMRWFYRVRATDASGKSAASAVMSIVNRPVAVTSATVTALSVSQLVLNWRDVSGESGYKIERSTNGTTFTTIATVATNVPSYAASGLSVGTNYWFRITPTSSNGDAESVIVSGSTRLQAVGTMSFTAKSSSAIGLSWTAVSYATGYRVERSTDGSTFTRLATVTSGLTYSDTSVVPLGEYYYRVIATNTTAEGTNPLAIFAAAPAAALPAGWASTDIGNVPGTGAAGYTNGTFTVVSSGNDIWGTADAFRYTYRTLSGDGWIVARAAVQENTAASAKLGVMIRETAASNSRHAMVAVTATNGVVMQSRSSAGGSSASIAGAKVAAPVWLKIGRTGNVFTGWSSSDGVTWTQIGTVTIAMGSTALIGIAADSNLSTALNTSKVDRVSMNQAAGDLAVTVSNGMSSSDVGGLTGGATLRKRGPGRLVLTASSGLTGGTVVEQGEIIVQNTAALGTGRLEVWPGAKVTLDVGMRSISLSSLVLNSLGRIDLGLGGLFVAAGGITEEAVRGLILSGRKDGGWDGTAGFVSSLAASGGEWQVGYTSDSSGITVALAVAGDTNLDGVVDMIDLAAVASRIDHDGVATWSDGDVDYDGVIDLIDLSAMLAGGWFDRGSYQSAAEAAFAFLGAG